MHPSLKPIPLLFLLLFFSSSILAELTLTTNKLICKTKVASTSTNNVPTVTKSVSRTKSRTFTIVTTPIVKYTPSPVTKATTTTIKVVTTTTAPAVTQTITSTKTDTTVVATTIGTAGETVVETTILYYTTTVPVPPSFTPVLDTLPGASLDAPAKARRALSRLQRRQSSSNTTPARYPSRVRCNAVTKIILVTVVKKPASTTKTITIKPSTILQTSTITLTSTSTVYPPNSFSTITSTSLVTSITTVLAVSTSTYTTTDTVLIAIATSYPQCAPGSRNFASRTNGNAISFWSIPDTVSYDFLNENEGATTAENCCIICYEDPTCGASYFDTYNNSPDIRTCWLLTVNGDVCDENNPVPLSVRIDTGPNAIGDSVSNNKCARWALVDT